MGGKSYKDHAVNKIINILENNEYKKNRVGGEKKVAVRGTDKITVGVADGGTEGQLEGQMDRWKDSWSSRLRDGQLEGQMKGQLKNNDFIWITEKQKKILFFLINQPNRVTRIIDIAKQTNIAYGTVRKSINKLVSKNCISKPERYRNGQFHGISYTINEKVCQYLHPQKNNILGSLLEGQMEGRIEGRTVRVADRVTDAINSSSSLLINNTTTQSIVTTPSEKILASHPELGYWREKGLTIKQIYQWMKLVGCSFEIMIQYLCYCRFDMVDLEIEESKNIKDVFSWFFRILERVGGYKKPKGYKSYKDKQIEEEKQRLKEIQKKKEELEKIILAKIEEEQALKFEEMMTNPEGKVYKKCFDDLDDFSKTRKHTKGFRISMRSSFDKLTEYDH